MLQSIAFEYLNSTHDYPGFTSLGLFIVGAAIASAISGRTAELRRAPYIALWGLLALCHAMTELVWLGILPAMSGGYLWLPMAAHIVGNVLIGYFIGVIAMARSRNAFGHAGYAVLALVPLANLILVFKGSKHWTSDVGTLIVRLRRAVPLVLAGFTMMVAGAGLFEELHARVDEIFAARPEDSGSRSAGIESMIRSQGLEAVLAQMAAEIKTPRKIDEVTTLVKIEPDATTLRYVYVLDARIDPVLGTLKTDLTRRMCAIPSMRPVLRAGGIIEHVFSSAGGRDIGTVRITSASCAQ